MSVGLRSDSCEAQQEWNSDGIRTFHRFIHLLIGAFETELAGESESEKETAGERQRQYECVRVRVRARET